MPSPRSTLFPYTTLFRSHPAEYPLCAHHRRLLQAWRKSAHRRRHQPPMTSAASRSEERVSRNAEPEIYTLSLHDALPISSSGISAVRTPSAIAPSVAKVSASAAASAPNDQRSIKIGRAGQQECRARDLHSFPTRRSSDLIQRNIRCAHTIGDCSKRGESQRIGGGISPQ